MSDQLDASAVEAVERLTREAVPVQRFTIGEHEFADRPLARIDSDPQMPKPLKVFGLEAFAALLAGEFAPEDVLVHVADIGLVEAVGRLTGEDLHLRAQYALAETPLAQPVAGFRFNQPTPLESLQIALLTCFAPGGGDVEELRKFCAAVRSTDEIGVADDGVSQEVQAKSGIAAVRDVPVRNPWYLAPWRTFPEIPQPTSPFVLRFVKMDDGLPRAALYETGNQAWRVEATLHIAEWLRHKLGPDWTVLG
jgi:hypothetical protein